MTSSDKIERIEADTLVIGSGLAGLFAALAAARRSDVALITKSTLIESNSAWAQGGMAAAISSEDSPDFHSRDTLEAGRGLCSEPAVALLTREGPGAVRALESLGVRFDRSAGGRDLGREGGHSHRRILHADGSATGSHVVRTLVERVRENRRILVFEDTLAAALLSNAERCFGVAAQDVKGGNSRLFIAGSTILATGGAASLYRRTTNPPMATGDGIALAYHAGAKVADLEFVQFHPTALYAADARAFLISEAIRGEGAFLLDHAGRRFLLSCHERAELAPRDVVSWAIDREMKRSGWPYVFLSLTHLDADFVKRRFANIYQACLERGLDMTRDRIPVAPAAHYTIGGVRTDAEGRTNIEGLLACGEVASSGVHGANRLASNSLLECVVFAGQAAHSATENRPPAQPVPPALLAQKRPLVGSPANEEHRRELGGLMSQNVGVVRDGPGLAAALHQIREWSKAALDTCVEWRDALTVADLIAQAALLRTETRGAHVREDFPGEQAAWRKHIVFRTGSAPEYVCC